MTELPPSLRRPRETYADYYDFVNLDNEWDAFDMSPSIGTDIFPDEGVYYGKEGTEWADTALYRLIGDRWVLIFVLFGDDDSPGPVDRELTPSQAARYLRFNELAPPPGLRPAPSVYDDAAERRRGQARLDRDWTPPVEAETERPDADGSNQATSPLAGADMSRDGERQGPLEDRAILEPAPRNSPGKKGGGKQGPLEDRAIALLFLHPGWTNRRLAEELGCHEKSLSRFNRFRKARQAIRLGKSELPRGSKDGETGDIEAWG